MATTDETSVETEGLVQQLRAHEIELEAQNEELRRTRQELEESCARLEESRARYQQLYDRAKTVLDTVADAIVSAGESARIEGFNRAAEELFGYGKDEVLGRSIGILMPAPYRDEHESYIRRYLDSGEARLIGKGSREVMGLRKDGSTFPLDIAIGEWRDGSERKFTAILRDLSLRKQVERDLRQSEARFREIAEHLVDGVMFSQREPMRALYANPALSTIFGRTTEDMAANIEDWVEWFHPDDRDRISSVFAAYVGGAAYDEEFRLVRPDGVLRWVRIRVFEVPRIDDSPTRDVCLVQDITADREREETLRQAQKMEAVGALASGAAHDFNNVLQAVLGCINVARRTGTDPHRAREYLDHAAEAALRGRDLADRLMAFTRRRDHAPAPVVLDEVVASVAALLGRLVTEQVTLVLRLGASGEAILADPTQIEQILMNLAANARDAMPAGGTLTISTRSIVIEDEHAHRHGVAVGSRWLRLDVEDTGTGMDEETQGRIFEPFFTTKGVGRGTGLGLSTVFAITRQLGGHVTVHSEPDRGTVFAIHLPRCDAQPEATRAPRRELPRFRGTALVVEDALLVRVTVRQDLEALGLHVIEADGVDAARELVALRGDEIDLLVSDVLLPSMPGPDLAEQLRTIHPKLRVVFMSATPERAHVDAPVLRKPFDVEELARALLAVLPPELVVGYSAVPTPPSAPLLLHSPAAMGALTILVVEDNAISRMAVADALEADGYRVLTAEAVQPALDLVLGTPEHVDLLLTDVNLPDAGGETLARKLRVADPNMRVVFMSGAVAHPAGPDPFVAKPIELDALLATIHATLFGA